MFLRQCSPILILIQVHLAHIRTFLKSFILPETHQKPNKKKSSAPKKEDWYSKVSFLVWKFQEIV